MAQAIIGGRTYVVAPFKLRELRLAAPFIDRVAGRARSSAGLSGVEAAAESAFDMLCVLAVGIEGAEPEALAADASLEELTDLRSTFDQVLAEAGLTRPGPAGADAGEPQPATANRQAPPAAPLDPCATGSTT